MTKNPSRVEPMKCRQQPPPAATGSATVPEARPSAGREWLIAGGLVVVTFVVYLPVLKCDFLNFDDDVYVTDQPKLKLGLSGAGLRWASTAIVSTNWHPLTLLSLLADYDLYGLKPWGYHLTNLLLHLANTVLWFFCLCRMTGAVWRSAVVAALFALHPMHVEVVAWVGDRTDLLSTFFGLLALRAYLWHAAAPSADQLLTATALLALSFMAKPIWITFPFLLLLLDFWPLRRAAAGVSWRRLVVEKVPFLLVVVAGSVGALVAHSRAGLIDSSGGRYSLAARAANAVVSYAEYLRQTFVPTDLAVVYPHPGEHVNVAATLGAGVVLVAISAFVIARRCPHPEWFMGWFWFVGTLVPLIGLVQFREVARADRYTYVAHVGLFLALVWATADLLRRVGRPMLAPVVAAAVLLACSVATFTQIGYWKDSVALWQHTLAVTTDNPMALQNYGEALANAGRLFDAYKQFDAYIRLRPNEARGYRHRGDTLWELGRLPEAAEDYQTALRLDPALKAPELRLNLGKYFLDHGQLDDAAKQFLAARELYSDQYGQLDDAAKQFLAARELYSDQFRAKAWYNLGIVRFYQKAFNEAEECFREATRLQPDEIDYQVARADALAEIGRFADALALLDAVLAERPVDPQSDFFRTLQDRRQRFEKKLPYRPE